MVKSASQAVSLGEAFLAKRCDDWERCEKKVDAEDEPNMVEEYAAAATADLPHAERNGTGRSSSAITEAENFYRCIASANRPCERSFVSSAVCQCLDEIITPKAAKWIWWTSSTSTRESWSTVRIGRPIPRT